MTFGGYNGSSILNDFWVLTTANGLGGTSAWSQLTTTGNTSTTRFGHSAIYDDANNRMTIFGGLNGNNWLNDVWVLSTANGLGGTPAWTQLSPTGSTLAPRSSNSAIYDPANNRMTIFGGYQGGLNYFKDLWVLSHANGLGGTPAWTQITTTGSSPTTRYYHTAIYVTTNNRMTVFGGSNGNLLNDVWVLTNANGLGGTPAWTQLFPTGSSPTTRYGHTAVYDTAKNRMTIFGGYSFSGYLNDVWVLTHANGLGGIPAWTQITTTGSSPTTRYASTAIYDAANNRMTIFAGTPDYSNTYLNDVWVLDNTDTVPVNDWMNYTSDLKDSRFRH
jgi:hypothetical protein